MTRSSLDGEQLALLKQTCGPVQWSDLRAHCLRDALFIVAPRLELLDAASAIAGNATARVEGWLQTGQLARPTQEQLLLWDKDDSKPFVSVVVQPFVLAAEVI